MKGTTMPGQDVQAIDRWATRRSRLAETLRQEGLKGLTNKFKHKGFTGGFLFAKEKLRYQLCSAFERAWDKKYGVDTSGQIDLENLQVIGQNRSLGHPVVSTSPRMFRFLGRYFPQNRANYTFVDVGCGKGRLVLLASQLGFKRVVGVEFCSLITQVAKSNISRFRGDRSGLDRCSIIEADATEYCLPEGPLVIYLNNPFESELSKKFFSNVVATFDRNKEPIRICLSGSVPEPVNGTAQLLKNSNRFKFRHSGLSPYFVDTYLPYIYWVFDVV